MSLRIQEGEKATAPVEGLSYRGGKAHSCTIMREKAVYILGFECRQVGRCEYGSLRKVFSDGLALLNERKYDHWLRVSTHEEV